MTPPIDSAALSYRELARYRVIDPTGSPIGRVVDATVRPGSALDTLTVRLFDDDRQLILPWCDAYISVPKRTVLVRPETAIRG